jgi:hypothetical protein
MSQYPRPPLAVSQLLRSLGQSAQKACNSGEHTLGPLRPAMSRSDTERGLAAVAGAFGNAGEQQRTAGDPKNGGSRWARQMRIAHFHKHEPGNWLASASPNG